MATNGVEVRGDGVIAFLQRFRHEIKQCGELADLVLRRGNYEGGGPLSDVPCTGGQIAQRSDNATARRFVQRMPVVMMPRVREENVRKACASSRCIGTSVSPTWTTPNACGAAWAAHVCRGPLGLERQRFEARPDRLNTGRAKS